MAGNFLNFPIDRVFFYFIELGKMRFQAGKISLSRIVLKTHFLCFRSTGNSMD